MVTTSVVRLGPTSDNVSATLLRTALVSHFQGADPTTDAINDRSGCTLTVSNRYFTADVILDDIGSTASSSWADNTSNKEDGIILVFDALQSNPDRPCSSGTTFDSLELAHDETETKDGAGDLLRLCVGVSLAQPASPEELRGKNADKEYSRRILWCLDRGYEYVEADLSQEGQTKGHNERDKEGFARIVEAIQGTVWSSAVMSKSKTNQLKETYDEDRTKALQQEEMKMQNSSEDENPYEPPDPSKMGSFSSVAPNGLASEGKGDVTNGLILEPEKVGAEDMANLRKDLEADQLFDKMEGVIREASRIRDASKIGEMTDEERRDRAGDAAMALVNLMTQFGLDDEDEGSHVDSSDDDNSGAAVDSK